LSKLCAGGEELTTERTEDTEENNITFGKWSLALKKVLHPFEIFLLDYREETVSCLRRDQSETLHLGGRNPDLRISDHAIEKQPAPGVLNKT
jgi:hypothetical protein